MSSAEEKESKRASNVSENSFNEVDDDLDMDLIGMQETAELLASHVEVKDRRYHLSTYKSCFTGVSAIDAMITHSLASTREDAVKLGQLLLDQGWINHVTRDHEFKDKDLFYRFTSVEDHGAQKESKVNQKTATWASFLGGNTPDITGSKLTLQAGLPEYNAYQHEDPNYHPEAAVAINVTPLDEHNVRLLDNVKPTGWKNPTAKSSYNLVAIGAGAGGLVSSSIAAGLGGKVAIIEKHLLGGDCLNVGCVPSKALIRCAHTVRSVRNAEEFGVKVKGDVEVDFGAIMKRMRKLRADISPNDSAHLYTKTKGIDVFQGTAKFISPTEVEVDGQVLKFSRCVVATGGRATLPPITGLDKVSYITNESIFNLTTLPKRLGVIGAGAIGLEMAQSFAVFGSEVTVFSRSSAILKKEDPDAARIIQDSLAEDGVNFVNSVHYKSIHQMEDGAIEITYTVGPEGDEVKLQVDQLLISAGRKPNVEGIGLEKARIKFDTKNGIDVNDYLQTTNSRVYAVGDCATKYQFTHVADFMARMVIRNMFFFGRGKFSKMLIPWATYTYPEVAHVGLYEQDAKAKGLKYTVYTKEFDDNDRAILDGDRATAGFVRIICKGNTDEIIGATIVSEHAGDMISELSVAIQYKVKLGQLASVIHPYPTQAEAIRQAGDLFNKTRLTPTVKALLRGILRRRQ